MSIQAKTKKEYRDYIRDCEEKISMTEKILKVIEEMKHRKNVNKVFYNRLKKDYDIWTYVEDNRNKRVTFSKRIEGTYDDSKLTFYFFEGITWEAIEMELKTINWHSLIKKYQTKLDDFDLEVEKLIKLKLYLKELNIQNYSIFLLESDLEHAITQGRIE